MSKSILGAILGAILDRFYRVIGGKTVSDVPKYPLGPHDVLLRRKQLPHVESFVGEMADVLERVVDFGTHVVIWVGPATAGTSDALTPPLMLLHHAVEAADSISILIRTGAADAVVPLLRSQMEATLSGLYILDSDTERRGLAYRFGQLKKRALELERFDPTTAKGADAAKRLAADATLKGMTYAPDPAALAAERLRTDQLLADSRYDEVRVEWDAIKARTKRDPAWHSLFGGPGNVADLAAAVKRAGWYDLFYREFSEEVHSSTAMRSIRGNPVTKAAEFRPFRYPEHAPSFLSLSTSMSFTLFAAMLERFEPSHVKEFVTWQVEYIRPDLDRLSRVVFKEPK